MMFLRAPRRRLLGVQGLIGAGILTVVLGLFVIFSFLRNVSATLIPSLALPASIVGTVGAMCLLTYSLDDVSLRALSRAVGFVVEGACGRVA